jgi:hypothetical protein
MCIQLFKNLFEEVKDTQKIQPLFSALAKSKIMIPFEKEKEDYLPFGVAI